MAQIIIWIIKSYLDYTKLYEKIRHTLSKNPRSATAITSPARSLSRLPTRPLARPALRCHARATAAASTAAAPHTPTKAVPLGSMTTALPPQGRAAAGIHDLCHCPAHPRCTPPSSITDPAKTTPPPESSLAPPLLY
jgi:hypothetical protein